MQFVPAVLSVGPQEPTSAELSPEMGERCGGHSIEVEIAGATVRITQGTSAAQTAAVIQALKACPYTYWIGNFDPAVKADVHLIKVHDSAEVEKFSSGRIFTSFRDIRAVVASQSRMGWLDINDVDKLSNRLD
ncbi:hypothetical protein MKK75_30545 [Methylobacterium sp. J-030]|uniref:hypothetical protein n=1 Tax=Methylobacterium sp. J-030 TaxID=2836627 RepID=UPI001FBA6229|nr:hypothetical protein [Methylobacterium sp. J-030]MCJ2073083.1 hypothetical protein [Methylobacterium sp. J-030]